MAEPVPVVDLIAKGRDGRAAMKYIKHESGNKRKNVTPPAVSPAVQSIPKLPSEFVKIKCEEINNHRRSGAIALKQMEVLKSKELIKLLEKLGEQDTDEYRDAIKAYKKLLVSSNENIVPIFSIDNDDDTMENV